ncbi:hypothetical protein [Flavobacterium psychrotrophum]|uniref:hypothetical protein n=1 Tax=Flavobacterium psychrotrophum TaxID=2294119 RepID=UPI000E324420|nr:hypothetical protein [Flavobacterium psychrotrophum]
MAVIDKNIVDAYSNMFEGLSDVNKLELLERLAKSLKKLSTSKREAAFYKSFGAFDDAANAEEIIKDIKDNRQFINKDISF